MTAIIDDNNANLIHPPVFEAMPSSIRQGITVIMIIMIILNMMFMIFH